METVFDFVTNIGPGASALLALLAVVVLVGAARGWWVWGHVYIQEREEKEYWRDKALKHLGLAEESLVAAETAVIEKPA